MHELNHWLTCNVHELRHAVHHLSYWMINSETFHNGVLATAMGMWLWSGIANNTAEE